MLQTEKRSCFPLIKLGNFYPLFITSLILCLPWSCLCWLHLLMWDEKGRKGKTWTTSIFLFILYICEQFFFSSLLPPSWERHVLEWEEHASKTRLKIRFVFMFFIVIQRPSSSQCTSSSFDGHRSRQNIPSHPSTELFFPFTAIFCLLRRKIVLSTD